MTAYASAVPTRPAPDAAPSSTSGPAAAGPAGLGARGLATRRRLLDALRRLLSEKAVAWISVADIARASGMSPATFYRYFADVDAAALALSEDVVDDLAPAVALVAPSWDGTAGLGRVMAFVEEFLAHWERNQAVLRLRNLAAEEGDARFSEVRLRTLRPLNVVLAAKVREHQREGNVVSEIQPTVAATALVGMLERIGAHRTAYERRGHDALVRTTAVIIQQSVCGGRSDP